MSKNSGKGDFKLPTFLVTTDNEYTVGRLAKETVAVGKRQLNHDREAHEYFNKSLDDCHRAGNRAVLIIDDAHSLPIEVLRFVIGPGSVDGEKKVGDITICR